MVNFPVFADDFGGGVPLSGGFGLKPSTTRLFIRYAFPCFARIWGGALLSGGIAALNPRLFIRCAFSCLARRVAGRPSLHNLPLRQPME